MKVDYIIVGQGLAGSWLSYELVQAGFSIVVINKNKEETSSSKAAGIYNPITGRKMEKTWLADQIFPTLEKKYAALEKHLRHTFLHPKLIYRIFNNAMEQNNWQSKMAIPSFQQYIHRICTESVGNTNLKDNQGGIILNFSGWIDIPSLIFAVQGYLQEKGRYIEAEFDYSSLSSAEEKMVYKEVEACGVIFCEGALSKNPFWSHLPFRPVRGELMDIRLELSDDYIINKNIFMIPKGGYFTVGSTYHHDILEYEPQVNGIYTLLNKLSQIYSGSIKVINKRAGVRPATHDRRPYIGFHEKFQNIGIFNGFGSKGVSLVPFYAKQFVGHILKKEKIDPDANVKRTL